MKAEVYTNESLRKLSNLSDNSIDLCLTDLPYGETAQDWDSIIPIEPMWKELKRVCKKDAAILLFASGGIYQAELILSQRRAFKFKYYWKKNRAGNCHQAKIQPMRNCEEIVVFCFGKLPYFPQKSTGHKPTSPAVRKKGSTDVYRQAETFYYKGSDTTRYPKTILEFDCLDNNSPERVHPNQKPVSLLQHLIRQHSKLGDTVLDFTCGSGSTGVAAVLEKRNFIGIDQDEKYCNHARTWMNKILGHPAQSDLLINKETATLFNI